MMPPGFCWFNLSELEPLKNPGRTALKSPLYTKKMQTVLQRAVVQVSFLTEDHTIPCKTSSLRRKVHFCADSLVFSIHFIALPPINCKTHPKMMVK